MFGAGMLGDGRGWLCAVLLCWLSQTTIARDDGHHAIEDDAAIFDYAEMVEYWENLQGGWSHIKPEDAQVLVPPPRQHHTAVFKDDRSKTDTSGMYIDTLTSPTMRKGSFPNHPKSTLYGMDNAKEGSTDF